MAQKRDNRGGMTMVALMIDETHAAVTFSDGQTQALDLDMAALMCRYFSRIPPDNGAWEEAIMTVEDAIAPWRDTVNAHMPSEKCLSVAASALLQFGGQSMTVEAVEQLFYRVSAYGFSAEILEQAAAYAQFLLVREFLHHMGFTAVQWLAEAA
ncbi:hypothetical protein J2T38_000053 [Neisseria perflava]|uniref:hypothetical protein n=1 Tax=Neisseria perflava TaxID=33053 RepID=UPI0020A06B04|nr:hypothetical protein [Neisseria perflava]MCP1771264.1 hypothetical protein [Neisseria perflava]